MKIGPFQYNQSKQDHTKHSIDEVKNMFNVSRDFVLKHIWSGEWHHCYLKYGDSAKAYFVTDDDIKEFNTNLQNDSELKKAFEKSQSRCKNRKGKANLVILRADEVD